MKIQKLLVKNFRNLSDQPLEFSPGINCIFGKNGNGKTNILEAIYYISNRKSFRKNASFAEFLSMDGENPEVDFSSTYETSDGIKSYSGRVSGKASDWYFDGRPQKRKKNIPIVFINPFESFNFHNNPGFRRTWIDNHLSMLDQVYKKELSTYTNRLKFINVLLSKKPMDYRKQIEVILPDFAQNIFNLTEMRLEFIRSINEFCCDTFHEIFSEKHNLAMSLDSDMQGKRPLEIVDNLKKDMPKAEILGHLKVGSHRDDYVLLFDGLNSYDFCSLGQQKMSYLSLLFAYIRLFRYKFKAFPIVLMDDVSGELDEMRWKRLISFLGNSDFQVFITTANEKFREELEKIEDSRKILVEHGAFQSL